MHDLSEPRRPVAAPETEAASGNWRRDRPGTFVLRPGRMVAFPSHQFRDRFTALDHGDRPATRMDHLHLLIDAQHLEDGGHEVLGPDGAREGRPASPVGFPDDLAHLEATARKDDVVDLGPV